MRRNTLTYLIVFLCLTASNIKAYEMPMDFYFQSEYRKDTIDYSSSEKFYYRNKADIFFSKESSFKSAFIYLANTNERKYTYNLNLNDISKYFSFQAGNFFVNFGSGLLIGKKRIYEADAFSDRIKNKHKKDPFLPDHSGNPVYSLYGMTCSSKIQMRNIFLLFNLFYSVQERYIDNESYEEGNISASIDSIDKNIDQTSNNNELININTRGAALSCRFSDYFDLQFYFLYSNINNQYKEEINWESLDYRNTDFNYGISKFFGNGIFFQYSDDFLSIILDCSASTRKIAGELNKSEYITGYGLLYGIIFAPPAAKIAIFGKQLDDIFYSPYSSSIGEDYPENAWFMECELKLFRNLSAGASASSQKKINPSTMDAALPVTQKEMLYINYSLGFLENMKVQIRRIEKTDEDRKEKIQIKDNLQLGLTDNTKLIFTFIFQMMDSTRSSKTYNIGLKQTLFKYFHLHLSYLSAQIAKNNFIYSRIFPIQHSSTPGILIKEDSHTGLCKIDFQLNKIIISFRYLNQFYNNEIIQHRLEFFGSMYF